MHASVGEPALVAMKLVFNCCLRSLLLTSSNGKLNRRGSSGFLDRLLAQKQLLRLHEGPINGNAFPLLHRVGMRPGVQRLPHQQATFLRVQCRNNQGRGFAIPRAKLTSCRKLKRFQRKVEASLQVVWRGGGTAAWDNGAGWPSGRGAARCRRGLACAHGVSGGARHSRPDGKIGKSAGFFELARR